MTPRRATPAAKRSRRLGLTPVAAAAARRTEPPAVADLAEDQAPVDEPVPEVVPAGEVVVRSPFPDRPYRDDEDGTAAAPVEQPIIHPSWNRENRRATLHAKKRRALHVAKFHAVRAPTSYPLLVAGRYPWGIRRLCRGLYQWWMDPRTLMLHDAARAAGDHRLAADALYRHERNWKSRSLFAVPALFVSTTAPAWLVAAVLNPATRVEAAAAAVAWVGGVGWHGRPQDRPLLPSATTPDPAVRKITDDMVLDALRRAKKSLSPEDDPAVLVAPGVYQVAGGYECAVDLPPGVRAADAMDQREAIASALRVDESRLEITRVRGNTSHAGRISMFISHEDPWTRAPVKSPLIGARTFSLWQPVPFATDSRGKRVAEPLIWNGALIGAMPRQGKSFTARLFAAAAALDPSVELLVANGKGGKDWQPTKEVAYWYGAGVREFVVDGLVKVLEEWLADMQRRYDILENLSDADCPDGKVTPELVDKRADMRLRVMVIDEVQEYLDDDRHGAAIKALLTRIAKLAPATGYMVVLATQKPDGDTLPTSLRDQLTLRICLKTANSAASQTVLGKLPEGVPRPEQIPGGQPGTAVLLGGEHEPGLVRSDLMDVVDFRKVCLRGRDLREAAHTLTGHAAGEDLDEPMPDRFLEHVWAAFEPGEDEVWSDVICERLGGGDFGKGDHPELYSGWESTDLANALLRYGVRTKDKAGYLDAEGRPVLLSGGAQAKRTTRKAVVAAEVRRALDARVRPTNRPVDGPGEAA